jgi:hypothetical protein
MLFAQAAFALAACDAARMPSRAAVLMQSAEHATPCHEPAENANLCLAHCQSAEQTLDKHQVKLPVFAPIAVLEIRATQDAARPRAWAPRAPSPAAGPPPRILYRSLLI